jgi:hypothetical protein
LNACTVLAIVIVGAATITGCNVMGVAANVVGGGVTSHALYTLSKRPTVVIAEKFGNPSEAAYDAEPLARYISEELQSHGITQVIDPSSLAGLQNSDPAKFRAMTIAEIGTAAGAEQIVYVNIVSSKVDLTQASEMLHGEGVIRVRVVDTATAVTLWPAEEAAGFEISAQTRMYNHNERGATEVAIRSELLRSLANRTARLFYTVRED